MCFVESDADESADQAILVGVKSDEDAKPVAITPLAYDVVTPSLIGAQFTVLSHEPETGAAQADVHKGIQQAGYGVRATYTMQYIPIYVPR